MGCRMTTDAHRPAAQLNWRGLLLALGLTLVVMVVEFVVGWISGSLALLADAGHMLTDAAALGLSLFAAWIAQRPATLQKTYGYYRTEILAALANGIALWLLVAWIYVRAFQRLQDPILVPSGPMIAVALLGLGVNLLSGWLLAHEQEQNVSLNLQGAWLNVMSDALGSVGVIVAGVLVRAFGWTTADPIASMVIGVLIAVSSWNLVRQSVNILLEGTPRHLRIPDVVEAMRSVAGVREVHDVHLWSITTGLESMSGHVVVDDVGRGAAILAGLQGVLTQRFSISHTTFQLEPRTHACPLRAIVSGTPTTSLTTPQL